MPSKVNTRVIKVCMAGILLTPDDGVASVSSNHWEE